MVYEIRKIILQIYNILTNFQKKIFHGTKFGDTKKKSYLCISKNKNNERDTERKRRTASC